MNFTIEKEKFKNLSKTKTQKIFWEKKITSFFIWGFHRSYFKLSSGRHVYSCPLNYFALDKGGLTNTRGFFLEGGACVSEFLLVCFLL